MKSLKYSRLKKNRELYWKLYRNGVTILVLLFLLSIASTQAVFAKSIWAPTVEVEVREKEIVREIEVDRSFKTEKQQILAYIIEKFGDDGEKAITMIYKCENSTFDPGRVSPLNIQQSGRRSYDIGVMQINVDEKDVVEQEKLKNWKYNIDRGYAKYKAAGGKFTAWTCAHIVGQKNYLGR